MSDSAPLKITDPNEEPVKFVNMVGGSGFLNGIANITLLTARWTPDVVGTDHVPVDLIVGSRLRFDLKCAQELRDVLDGIIEANTKPATKGH
jgi:hypothetical protein